MKTVKFYYVRHGETLFNKIGKMQGWCDSPLTKEGINQAYEAKEELKNIPFKQAFTSTSERCIDTAKIILEDRNIPLHFKKGLKEVHFGTFEGATIKNHLYEIDKVRNITLDWSIYGGENIAMLEKRIHQTYDDIFDKCQDQDDILIVSHGAIFIHMTWLIFGLDLKKFKDHYSNGGNPIKNGYVGVFQRKNDQYQLLEIGNEKIEEIKKLRKDL